jgi:hypothetical protein
MYKFYGIYEVGKDSVYVFMDENTYHRAYFSDRNEAEEICKQMNMMSDVLRCHFEVREI